MIDKIVELFKDTKALPIYIFEFVVFTLIFFFMLNVLRKNNAKLIIVLLVVFTAVVSALCYLDIIDHTISIILFALFALGVVILFATEIKREVWNSSIKGSDVKHWDNVSIRENAKECTNEIIKAVQSMSKNNVGAIIILANSNMPSGILDSGVAVNSDISSALIESIFFPKTPLHDGAMVINGTKIQAAGCFLPLSQEISLPKELGTRHRAGIGITETINVTAIIVSEETGVISVATGGKLKRYADTEMLKNTLKSFYWQDMLGN